jgi:hypothetical protein
VDLWVDTNVSGTYTTFFLCPEDGGSIFLVNFGMNLPANPHAETTQRHNFDIFMP